MLRLGLDSDLRTTALFPLQNNQNNEIYLVPRMMLLRADLAAALHQRDEARTWYQRFLGVWSTASPEFQPVLERVRKSLADVAA